MAKVKTEMKEADESGGEKPVWLKFNDKDIEAIILKLSKQGLTSEKIGLALRDTYGIPRAKILGKKISRVLKENNLYEDTDLANLEKKQQVIKSHIEKHKKDEKAKRALTLTTAKIFEHKKYKKK